MKRLTGILCGLIGIVAAVGVGVVVGVLGWSHFPEASLGVVAGVVAGIAAFSAMRMLWAHKVGRVVLVLAIAGHVGFWTYRGIQATGARAPSMTDGTLSLSWPSLTTFRAGYARVPFDVPIDAPLAGWGSSPRRTAMPAFAGLGPIGRWSLDAMASPDSAGRPRRPLLASVGPLPETDRVGAAALVLRPDGGAPPIAWISVDTVTVDQDVVAAIAREVAHLGLSAPGLLVTATHTHSGPGGYSKQPLSQVLGTGHFHQASFDAMVAAAAQAVINADASASPAHAAIVRAHDRGSEGPVLALNRRRSDQTIDDRVLGLRLQHADGRPLAYVVNYAVHPVVFRRRYPATERDVVGAIERELEARLGAPVLYFNGALGDISPQPTPGLHRAERCAALAKRFADVVEADLRTGTAHAEMRIRARLHALDLGTPLGARVWGDRTAIVAAARTPFGSGGFQPALADGLTLPLNAFVWSLGLTDVRVVARFGEGLGLAANMRDVVPRTTFAVGALSITCGDERMAVVWQPGEATQAVGRAWRARAATHGFPDTMIFGLTNGACAYLTAPDEYARSSYEAEATLFGAEAATAIGDALLLALESFSRE